MRIHLPIKTWLFLLVFLIALLTIAAEGQDKNQVDVRSTYKLISDILKEGVAAYNTGDPESAKKHFDSILVLDAANSEALFYNSRIVADRGDSTAAAAMLEEAIAKAPHSSRLKLFLAKLELNRNLLDEADSLVNEILFLQPANGRALFMKGRVYLERGDTLNALENLEKALATAVSERE